MLVRVDSLFWLGLYKDSVLADDRADRSAWAIANPTPGTEVTSPLALVFVGCNLH